MTLIKIFSSTYTVRFLYQVIHFMFGQFLWRWYAQSIALTPLAKSISKEPIIKIWVISVLRRGMKLETSFENAIFMDLIGGICYNNVVNLPVHCYC